jgi:hypothetical protein
MLDTRTYEIDFPDGHSDEYTANVIVDNMYAQCDIEGRQYNLMEGIVDHTSDLHAVEPADMYIKHGKKSDLLKLLNMLLQTVFLTLLISCGGTHMSSRSAVDLLPL